MGNTTCQGTRAGAVERGWKGLVCQRGHTGAAVLVGLQAAELSWEAGVEQGSSWELAVTGEGT